ncbi:hypothetical protein H5410_026283 [Solanum commersonii]|uniref:Uncharacterized protein n=1 Tax=Solanum commersonii TaxID=4109 RepID=A0A9J5YYI2_SOLCO|nr:hypothetical protein H5410_026283 [Solanum commersonii]
MASKSRLNAGGIPLNLKFQHLVVLDHSAQTTLNILDLIPQRFESPFSCKLPDFPLIVKYIGSKSWVNEIDSIKGTGVDPFKEEFKPRPGPI